MSTLLMIACALLSYQAGQETPPDDPWTLRGEVVDPEGRPVEGAIVRPIGGGGARQVEAHSDTQGRFSVSVAQWRFFVPRTAPLHVRSPDGTLQTLLEVPRSEHGVSPIHIVVTPARPVRVRVMDTLGNGVVNARVFARQEPFYDIAEAVTDDRGETQLLVPHPAKIVDVLAFKDGTGFDYFENYAASMKTSDEAYPPLDSVTLTLNGARTARVKVEDADGKPLEGIRVYPSGVKKMLKLASTYSGDSFTSTTNAQGVAEFRWLPVDLHSAIPFLIQDERYVLTDFTTRFDPAVDQDKLIRIRAHELATLSGKVSNAEGEPVAGIFIRAGLFSDPSVRTDREGQYVMRVRPNTRLTVRAFGDDATALSRKGIEVKPGDRIGGVDFQLTTGTRIHGRLTLDPGGEVGQRLGVVLDEIDEDAPPSPTMTAGQVSLMTIADSEGRFSFRVAQGRYRLRVIATGVRDPKLVMREIVVTDQDSIQEDFILPAAEIRERTLIGTVVGPDDRPSADAHVVATRGPSWSGTTTRSDAMGHFSLKLKGSPHLIYACSRDSTHAVAVRVEAETEELVLPLEPACAVVGRVVDERGRIQPGTRVTMDIELTIKDPDGKPYNLGNSMAVDANGAYHFGGIPTGSRVTIRAPRGQIVLDRVDKPDTKADDLVQVDEVIQ